MSTHTSDYAAPFTDLDIQQLLEPVDEVLLHYYQKAAPTRPALCGDLPIGSSWADTRHDKSSTSSNTPNICPACQVAYSHLPGPGAK